MPSIDVEVCIDSRSTEYVAQSVEAAINSGAKRVELCSDMYMDGLTPPKEHIEIARDVMGDLKGLLCMIRPRGGNFIYSEKEIRLMEKQIIMAAGAGADGVVLGVQSEDLTVDGKALKQLTAITQKYDLSVTFHRAFDAMNDPMAALNVLQQNNINRILSCGIPWRQEGSAVDGLPTLKELVSKAGKDLEIVVGGGLTKENIGTVIDTLKPCNGIFSLHFHSGVLKNSRVSPDLVSSMCHHR